MGFVTKPISGGSLSRIMTGLEAVRRPFAVLTADDSRTGQALMKRGLDLLSIESIVTGADDGRMAVEACNREYFDIIFLDVHMPDMTGGDVPVDVANGWALPRLTTTRPRRGWQGWNGRQGSLRAPLSGPAGRL